MKITIEEGKCISAGNCALIAPELFDQSDDDGSVVVLDDAPPPELHESARQAAAACPALAIQIHESATTDCGPTTGDQ